MIIEAAIAAALLLAWFRAGKAKKGELTAERKAIFQAALETLEDSGKLRELADVFATEGLTVQADLLKKRANLRELPETIKRARHEAFLKAMSASDPAKVEEIALLFENEGAIGASNALRGYSAGLRAGTAAPYVAPPVPPVAITPPGATPHVQAPPVPSAPAAPTGTSPAPAVAAAGAPAHEVAASTASTGQAVVPSISPSGQVAQTPDNPSGLPLTGPAANPMTAHP
jgi:hypothetical protein